MKIPALSALSALAKAEREDVQLWEAVHFWEIISALHLPFPPFLPPLEGVPSAFDRDRVPSCERGAGSRDEYGVGYVG